MDRVRLKVICFHFKITCRGTQREEAKKKKKCVEERVLYSRLRK